MSSQPIQPNRPPRLLRWQEVAARCGLGRSGIYYMMRAGKFPQCIPLAGSRAVGWREDQVDDWIRTQINNAPKNRAAAKRERANWAKQGRKPKHSHP